MVHPRQRSAEIDAFVRNERLRRKRRVCVGENLKHLIQA
jgi:hypothetical protein